MEYKSVHMGPAKCGLDIGDGSERGEYVCQDYIINTLGRPHRMVNIMYTYYPKDEKWPARISEACKDMEVSFAWDYPYDDYFPFNDEGKQYEQMRDIRMHGQDVHLTLTIDCSLEDSYLREIAKKLSTFGRIWIRINHECHGTWFTHNQRFSYEEIGKFFVRFHKIIKEEAPNVSTVFCAGIIAKPDENGVEKVEKEEEFKEAYQVADAWSADNYPALHFGWPYDIAEVGGGRYHIIPLDELNEIYKKTYNRITTFADPKPFMQAEFNVDGDVTGPWQQGEPVVRYYNMIKNDADSVVNGISMYQFRDRGRLGLEIEDPNNSAVGIKQPIMDEYKELLFDDYFYPKMTIGDNVSFPAKLRWGGSEDADGISLTIKTEGKPEFFEVTLQKDLALMIEFHDKWFYKAPGVETIDLMPAFFNKPITEPTELTINIFATTPDGENHDDGSDDWAINVYSVMNKEPEFRIRYEVPGLVG